MVTCCGRSTQQVTYFTFSDEDGPHLLKGVFRMICLCTLILWAIFTYISDSAIRCCNFSNSTCRGISTVVTCCTQARTCSTSSWPVVMIVAPRDFASRKNFAGRRPDVRSTTVMLDLR